MPEVEVATILTTSLTKIFKIFKPEQIRQVSAQGKKSPNIKNDNVEDLGLSCTYADSNVVVLDYNQDRHPVLTEQDVKKILQFMNSNQVKDLIISNLEIELSDIGWDDNKFGIKLEDSDNRNVWIANLRNEETPDSKREMVKEKNYDIPGNGKSKNRLLVLYSFLQKPYLNVPPRKRPYLINLPKNWKEDSITPKWGGYVNDNVNDIDSCRNTIRSIQFHIGTDWCMNLTYFLNDGMRWELKR